MRGQSVLFGGLGEGFWEDGCRGWAPRWEARNGAQL